jgi:hypothetical protein
MRSYLAPTAAFLAFLLTPYASAQNLQPESRQEFLRVYGTSAPPVPAQSGTVSATATLQPETVSEFRRVFGQNVLTGTTELQKLSSPESINSTALTALTTSTDKRKYYILWHLIAVDLTAIDHRAVIGTSPSTFHEQFGPARTARALGLIHQAMFEAANAFDRKYKTTLPVPDVTPTSGASQDAAIIEAAYQTISWLYPGLVDQAIKPDDQNNVCAVGAFSLTRYYVCSLDSISDVPARNAGIAIGRSIAGKIIADRSHDGSERPEPVWGKDFIPRYLPGAATYPYLQWLQDPVSQFTTALGGYWGQVRPFAMTSGFQFRPTEQESPVAKVLQLTPATYKNLDSYNAVRMFGREARLDATGKIQPPSLEDGIFIAQFWAYDATANLCAPARLYNQIAAHVLDRLEKSPADGYGNFDANSITDIARFYALVNIAMADAAMAAWDAKFYFQFPRPVTYIRANDEATAMKPPGEAASKWFPLGAQVTNSDQPFNITPPFPSYPSGHAVFGGTLFGTLRQFVKPATKFMFKSDEFNGKNKDVYNYIRCSPEDKLTPRNKFCKDREFTLDCAERENADSRIFMGVHWVFDADDGIVMGNRVARQTYRYLMKPLDAQGQPVDPPTQTFSVASTNKKRADLVCAGITLPPGWDDLDAKKGFGELKITIVN